MAIVYGRTDAVDVLLDYEATVDRVDKNGRSAVFLAAENNQIDILNVSLGFSYRRGRGRGCDIPSSPLLPPLSLYNSTF